ncbi:hypothetical protein AB0J86_28160 [Micromonospora sp. NPDC049559]|uniref:hypothetical protein n=1 Tax=Micromonospora sp. NPDC049559 TaxID=3155923 RepID=UPI003429C59B
MGFFNSKKKRDETVPQTPQWEKPPPGGTAAQRRSAALRREQELMAAIERRGKRLGMSTGRIIDVQSAARDEIRRRGMSYEQMPPGDPEMDFDLYGI